MKIILAQYNGYTNEFSKLIIDKNLKFPMNVMMDNIDLSKFTKVRNIMADMTKCNIYDERYFVINPNDAYHIVDIDTSRKWYIDYYDMAMGVVYLDDYKLDNPELNFYVYEESGNID